MLVLGSSSSSQSDSSELFASCGAGRERGRLDRRPGFPLPLWQAFSSMTSWRRKNTHISSQFFLSLMHNDSKMWRESNQRFVGNTVLLYSNSGASGCYSSSEIGQHVDLKEEKNSKNLFMEEWTATYVSVMGGIVSGSEGYFIYANHCLSNETKLMI